MSTRRGMTLLETMVAMALTAVIIAAAAALLMAGGRVVHNTEHVADSHDAARLGGDAVMNAVRQAGTGSSGGVWLVQDGASVRTNAVFGRDGTTGAGTAGNVQTADGSDDLWLLVPHSRYMEAPCSEQDGEGGAAVSIVQSGTGELSVNCTENLELDMPHLASNMTGAALLTGVAITLPAQADTPGRLSYAEQGQGGFSNAPEKGGFQRGDKVYPVRLLHFFIGPHPVTGRPSLLRTEGVLDTDDVGRPYSDSGADPVVVQEGVEDLQVAFGFDTTGTGDPAQYTWRHGLGSAYEPGLRTVRVSVVGTGTRPRRDMQSQDFLADDTPMAVENHTRANPPADGFFRSLYSRRLELPNFAAANL